MLLLRSAGQLVFSVKYFREVTNKFVLKVAIIYLIEIYYIWKHITEVVLMLLCLIH